MQIIFRKGMWIIRNLWIGICVTSMPFLVSFPRVHVFGDSHAHFCFSDHGQADYSFAYSDIIHMPFSIHWLGPKTMHNVGKNGLNALNLKNYNIAENDVAVFAFGEIDVRCHVGKQRDHNKRDVNEILDALVVGYFNTINQNKGFYQKIYCVVMEVVPPTDGAYSPEYPFYGSLEDRASITLQLNKKLQEVCLQNDVIFLKVQDFYARSDGTLDPALSDGNVHVNMNYNYLVKRRLVDLLAKIEISKAQKSAF